MSQTILLTGASKGLGAALAARLAPGNHLVLTWHSDRIGIDAVTRRCLRLGAARVDAVPLHLESDRSLESLEAFVAANAPAIDIAIWNAGVLVKKRFEDVTAGEIILQHRINVVAPQLLTSLLLEHLERLVVFVGSDVAIDPVAGMAPYCATKAGIRGFARALALDVPRLQVMLLNPDRTATQMNDGEGRDVEVVATAMADAIEGRLPGMVTANYTEVNLAQLLG